jgi:hypothetical protein
VGEGGWLTVVVSKFDWKSVVELQLPAVVKTRSKPKRRIRLPLMTAVRPCPLIPTVNDSKVWSFIKSPFLLIAQWHGHLARESPKLRFARESQPRILQHPTFCYHSFTLPIDQSGERQ